MSSRLRNTRNKKTGKTDKPPSIGRITEALFLPLAQTVDVIEPIQKFTDALSSKPGIGRVLNAGLQDWQPEPGVLYDIVWNQWCVGHLTDRELVEYLVRCGIWLA